MANMNDVERIELVGGIGFDAIEVENLAGTDVKLVSIDLGSTGGTKGDSARRTRFSSSAAAATIRSPSRSPPAPSRSRAWRPR